MIHYTYRDHQPLVRILSKAFLRPDEFPEVQIATYFSCGTSVEAINVEPIQWTPYYLLRTGIADWTWPKCGNLPAGIDAPPRYWVVPWADKPRKPVGPLEHWCRKWRFRKLLRQFKATFDAMRTCDWVGPPLSGILLVDNDQDRDVFVMTDGHHRVATAYVLRGTNQTIPVYTPDECVFDWKRTRRVSRGRFSEADARRWWEHAFARIYDA